MLLNFSTFTFSNRFFDNKLSSFTEKTLRKNINNDYEDEQSLMKF